MDTVLNNLKQNLVGIVDKAIIEVIDMRNRPQIENGPVEVRGNMAGQRAQLDGGQAYADAGMMQDVINEVDKMSGKPPSIAGDFRGAKAKYYTVQFNPNSLRLSGHSGGLVKKTSFNKTENLGDKPDASGGIEYGPGKTYIDFSVSLLFDKVDPQDAFLEDKLATSLTSVGKGIGRAVMTGMGKKVNSVQPEVEGFIAALRNPHTRLITFHWGDFNYSGKLRNVNAVYNMFNVNGQPIRATVGLTMTCADSEISKNSIKAWNKRYFDAFKKGSESFVSASQKAKGLINI